jgi:hypothetical protein
MVSLATSTAPRADTRRTRLRTRPPDLGSRPSRRRCRRRSYDRR